MRAAVKVPSGCLVAAAAATAAPDLSSFLSAISKRWTGTFGPTMSFFSPSLNFTVRTTAADIKAGDYVASGGVPQPDGTQKGVELRIFPDSVRGNGDGHRPGWPGAPNGTMTNGAVGQSVTSVDGRRKEAESYVPPELF
jgi:hypothetical protein